MICNISVLALEGTNRVMVLALMAFIEVCFRFAGLRRGRGSFDRDKLFILDDSGVSIG
jgi:hypothetical protein